MLCFDVGKRMSHSKAILLLVKLISLFFQLLFIKLRQRIALGLAPICALY